MKLRVIIEKDETGYYVAEVPALPGCMSQGKTLQEARTNIREAIEGWVAVEAVKKFRRAGWTVARQVGSHVMMVRPGYLYTLSVPQHPELGIGLLKKLLRQANLAVDEFNEL